MNFERRFPPIEDLLVSIVEVASTEHGVNGGKIIQTSIWR